MESEDELWELKDNLSAAGFHVSEVIDHGFIHSIYAHDPNGIPVEFSHNVEGIDIRANPNMSDLTASDVTKEGTEPRFDEWPEVMNPTPMEERRVLDGAGSRMFQNEG